MANIFEKFDENIEKSRSRRGFFTWIGQITAGISIAGMGLGLVKPLEAFAMPNCNPCRGCKILCQLFNQACCPNPNYPILLQVQNITGCVPPGCAYSKPYWGCSTLDTCPVLDTPCSTCG